jgi:hypothetical protein
MAITLPPLPNPIGWFSHPESSRPTAHRERIGKWVLQVDHDPFTGQTWCRLKGGGMTYGPAAMIFKFDSHTDTFGAVYRIDGGPAVSWRVNAMTLASRGVTLQTDALNNPSGGRVYVPTAALAGAQTITIRPSPTLPTRTFDLSGLPGALGKAQAAGCGAAFEVAADQRAVR